MAATPLPSAGGAGGTHCFRPQQCTFPRRVRADAAQFLSVLGVRAFSRKRQREGRGTVLRGLPLSTYMTISSVNQMMTQVTSSKTACQRHRTSWEPQNQLGEPGHPENARLGCQRQVPSARAVQAPPGYAQDLLLKRQVEPETQAQTLCISAGVCGL